jgi:ABC-type bacteriocin/lantibiotic exporter with double-glycine peptidase domain
MMTLPIIQMKDVAVHVEGRDILSIDRLEIAAGERIAFIGNSGSGKTTLMRLLKGRCRCSDKRSPFRTERKSASTTGRSG